MRIPILVAAGLAAILAAAVAAGCSRPGGGNTPAPAGAGETVVACPADSRLAGTLRDMNVAPAGSAVAEPMRPFFAAGLVFIVLGGLAVCLGAGGTGLLLVGMGAATTATGVLFVQYPWAVLVLTVAAGLAAALALYGRRRARLELGRNQDALAAAAEVIQNAPEGKAIKEGLSGLGREIEAKVRAVIDPIKERLRREGKIE